MTDICQQQIYRLFAADRHLSIASSVLNNGINVVSVHIQIVKTKVSKISRQKLSSVAKETGLCLNCSKTRLFFDGAQYFIHNYHFCLCRTRSMFSPWTISHLLWLSTESTRRNQCTIHRNTRVVQ